VQFPSDVDLAAALNIGQKRHVGTRLFVDWARDGLFADAMSNLSGNVDEWSLERSLAGVVPDQLQATEGYSTAKLTITLSGERDDGLGHSIPMWKLFSPYSGLSYGSGSALNIPLYLRVSVQSPLGYWEIDQITGWIDSVVPDLAKGTVTMVCFDGGGQLETGITVDRWAADQYRREVYMGDTASNNADETAESCTIEAGWLIDTALRRTGFYEGPPWHGAAIHARTLRGSTLPEIGGWNSIPIQDFDPVWSSGMIFSTPYVGPAMQTPGEVWPKASGKYGPGYAGRYRLGNWKATGQRGITTITAGTKAIGQFNPTGYGSNNSNMLGWAGWVFIDSTLSLDPWSTDQMYLSAKNGLTPANASVTIKHKTNIVAFSLTNDGGGQSWDWSVAAGGNGWHYVSVTWQFTSTQVWGSMWLDGVRVINQTNGGRVGALPAPGYTWIEGETNSVFLSLQGPMQYTQWIYTANLPIASYVQPFSTPPSSPRQQSKVDITGQRLLHFPNIENTAAGNVIKSLVGADLGAFYFTEQGVATFDNRATIKARQLAANSVFDVTINNASNLRPVSAYVSVANRIGYTAKPRVAQPFLHAYAASKPDQFVIQNGGTPRFTVTLSDVQAIRAGQVSVRLFAQGYDVGLSPPTLFWQEYMQHYNPNYWEEGTTPYQPGSQPSNGPPPVLTGAFVYALPGWVNPDTNSRHMRLAFGNSSGVTAQFSVNDSTAFLVVGGTLLQDRPTVTESVFDATSIARYRERVYNLPADDWHQDLLWLRTSAASLLLDTKVPTVQFEDIEVVGDPRRQLQDVCRIIHQDTADGSPGMTGTGQAYGSVVGITRKFTGGAAAGKLTDTLTIRTFAA
jgi:hypothetical protein